MWKQTSHVLVLGWPVTACVETDVTCPGSRVASYCLCGNRTSHVLVLGWPVTACVETDVTCPGSRVASYCLCGNRRHMFRFYGGQLLPVWKQTSHVLVLGWPVTACVETDVTCPGSRVASYCLCGNRRHMSWF